MKFGSRTGRRSLAHPRADECARKPFLKEVQGVASGPFFGYGCERATEAPDQPSLANIRAEPLSLSELSDICFTHDEDAVSAFWKPDAGSLTRQGPHRKVRGTMIKLYYAPHACSLASHIALEEAGAAYSTVRIDFASNEQRSPEYLAINPKGRVPAMVTERGILTETPAMLAFIAQSFPQARMAPLDDPFAFAQVQAFNSYLCATLHVAHAHRMRGHRWADDPAAIAAMQRKVPQSVAACYELIENGMLKGPWVMGDAYTICDPYLFTVAQWLEGDGIKPAQFPRVADHRRRMSERPAVRKVVAEELAPAVVEA
jgi:glutathione S-transferase